MQCAESAAHLVQRLNVDIPSIEGFTSRTKLAAELLALRIAVHRAGLGSFLCGARQHATHHTWTVWPGAVGCLLDNTLDCRICWQPES
jgi:hypothetical protein